MKLYFDATSSSTGVKLLISLGTDLYLISDIINDNKDGWQKNAKNPKVQSLTLIANSLNPLFAFSLSNVDFGSSFMFQDSSSLPIFFGNSSTYW